jgi:hypothetical protein
VREAETLRQGRRQKKDREEEENRNILRGLGAIAIARMER